MYKLIGALPPESYYMMTSFYNIDPTALRLGQWLAGEYVFYDRPTATKDQLKSQATQPPAAADRRQWAVRLKTAIRKSKAIGIVTGIPIIFSQVWDIYHQGKRLINDQPSIGRILGFSDYGPAMLGSYLLHRATRRQLGIFLFDIYKGNDFFFPGNPISRWLEPRIFQAADKIIVTNQGTKDFYMKRYGAEVGLKITVIHNSSFPEAYQSLHTPYSPQPPYQILFTGSIYWAQIRSLQNLVAAVNGLSDLDIRIKIYAPHPKDYLASYGISGPQVDVSVAAPDQMAQIQNEADILFLPLSWHTKSPDIINTATPGKLTDYLIASRPILVHAPASTYLVRYTREHDCAMIVDQEDTVQLQQAIRLLLTDLPRANQMISSAAKLFEQNHNAHHSGQLFRSTLLED
jgi:glycosyltransferase involved in cell wall biosynthesis